MKLLSLVLSFLITFNVLAASGTTQELERVLDDYQYALTVEWDQKDQVVYEKETKAFFEKLAALIGEQGISKEQVIAMAEAKMGNKKAFEALKLKFSLMGEVKSSEELAKFLKENSKEFYQQGAAWTGDPTMTLIWIGLGALVAYAIWFEVNYKCVAYEEVWACDTYTNSEGTHSSTTCGWDTQCSRYEKK